MVSFIITHVLSFFAAALALKLALGAMGQPRHLNKYGTAVTVAAILTVSSAILSLLPLHLGWFIYPLLWLLLVKAVYHIGVLKSLAVGMLQLFIRAGLIWIVHLIFG